MFKENDINVLKSRNYISFLSNVFDLICMVNVLNKLS